jgi:anti-sigma28 factor (negative regulator of flagellin synthesis)
MEKMGAEDEKKTAEIINKIKNGSYKVDDDAVIASILKGFAE